MVTGLTLLERCFTSGESVIEYVISDVETRFPINTREKILTNGGRTIDRIAVTTMHGVRMSDREVRMLPHGY